MNLSYKAGQYTSSAGIISRRDCYIWTVWGKKAQECLQALRPCLVVKGEQADEALTLMIGPKGKRRTNEMRVHDEAVADRVRILKRVV